MVQPLSTGNTSGNMKRNPPELQKLDVKRKKVLFSSPNDPPLSPESPTELEHCENEHDSDSGPQDLNLATPTPSVSESPSRDESMEVEEEDREVKEEKQPSRAELMAKKLMPELSERDQIKNIIRSQFDLEILLKHRELRLIEDEMAKIQIMMIQLKQHSVSPKVQLPNEPANFVETYAHYLKHPGDASKKPEPVPESVSTRPQRLSALRSQTRSIRTCITRRSDGALVKLVCSGCKRSNFGGVQGFINHCRISHSLEFSSHEQAANASGVVIDEEEYAAAASANASATAMTKSARSASFTPTLPVTHSSTASPIPTQQQATAPTTTSTNAAPSVAPASSPATSYSTPPTNFPPTAPPSRRASEVNTPMPPAAEHTKVNHLASFLKTKDINLDLDGLVVRATEKLTKSYLIEGEEDFEPSDGELGDDATPIQRVMAEAKRLRLNVDEVRKAAVVVSGDAKQNKKTNNKKKIGAALPPTNSPSTDPSSRPSRTSRSASPSMSADDDTKPSSRNSRRMPSDPCPLVTRRRAAQLEMEKRGSEPENCAKEALETESPSSLCKKKENNVIGNISKYIQLSRFF